MEETSQQDLEYKNPNGDQGGTGRQLRDRELLRRRKAEAEEKETNEWVLGMENQRKRSRAADKSSTKRRGRPRKNEPTPEIVVVEQGLEVSQEAPAVVVVPEPVEVIPDQIPNAPLTSLTAAETQSGPVLESAQSPAFAPILIYPAPDNQAQDTTPAQDATPAPEAVSVPDLSQDSDPAEVPVPPSTLPQVEILYTGSQAREAFDQILIEDLGPDEEEDIAPTEDKNTDEDLSETPLINIPEQSKMYSLPTLSSPPVSQDYLPENSL